jgi:anti-sigma regulatory factor (Ser/Thr protein kinase)
MDVCFKFLMPSDPRFLAVVRATVGELGSVYGFPEEDCRGITLAVDEAVANIIRHAYRGEHDGRIEVNCHARPDRLEFKFFDQGEAPDPVRLVPHPLDCMALSGRGTHIIRSIMDEVSYEQVPGGNQLRLSKRMPTAQRGAAKEEPAHER